MTTQYYRQWQLPTLWEHGHSRKNMTHNQRPARSTGLGKNKGFPANQKGLGKSKGWKWKKSVHPASRKPEREAWAKKGIPVDWKPERAVQEKVRDWSVSLCLIGSSCDQTSISTIKIGRHQPIWSTFGQVAKWWDARRHKGNSRVGTQWDYSHRCFV